MDTVDFSFEEWMELAQADPAAFEARRRELIESFLENSSREQRAIGFALQREIDYERARAASPQASFEVIARMLCRQLMFLDEGLHSLRESISVAALDRLEKLI